MRRNQTSAVTGPTEVRGTFKPRHNGRKRNHGPAICPRDFERRNVPRITRFMALAINFGGMVRGGRCGGTPTSLGWVT